MNKTKLYKGYEFTMRNLILKIIMFCMVPVIALAQKNSNVGLGGVAHSLMDPVSFASGFLQGTCLLLGGAFLFASIVKYIDHRRSPTMVPMSTVVFLIIAGTVLIAIPLLT